MSAPRPSWAASIFHLFVPMGEGPDGVLAARVFQQVYPWISRTSLDGFNHQLVVPLFTSTGFSCIAAFRFAMAPVVPFTRPCCGGGGTRAYPFVFGTHPTWSVSSVQNAPFGLDILLLLPTKPRLEGKPRTNQPGKSDDTSRPRPRAKDRKRSTRAAEGAAGQPRATADVRRTGRSTGFGPGPKEA